MIIPESATLAVRSATLAARRVYCNGSYYTYSSSCRSKWSSWGRWVVVGIVIFFALLLIASLLCFRRRRARRNKIAYTTSAPMTTQQPYHNNQQTQPQYENTGYGAPNTQYQAPGGPPPGYGNQNEYYGQQTGVSQPPNAYHPQK